MKNKKIFGLNRNVFFMGLVSFFNDFSNEMILSIFPAFFAGVLKSGAASLGLVEGVADGASQFIKIFSGRLSDKIQKRKLLAVVGYSVSVLTRPFYSLSGKVAHILSLRVIDRMGKGLREAPRDALISLSVPKEELGRSFGFHRAMDSLGSIAGPLVAYFILKSTGNFNSVFLTAFFVGLMAIFSFVFIKEIKIASSVANRQARAALPLKLKTSPFSFFVLSLGTLPVAVLLLRTQDMGFTLASIPLFYLIYSVSYTALSFSAGKLADRIGDRNTIIIGYLFLLASYLLMIIDGRFLLVVAFVLLGVFSALTDGVQRSFVARATEPENRGAALGLLNAMTGLGLMVAGVAGGWLWQNIGAEITVAVAAGIATVGSFLLFLAKRKADAVAI